MKKIIAIGTICILTIWGAWIYTHYDLRICVIGGMCEDNIEEEQERFVYADDKNGNRYFVDMEKDGNYEGDKIAIIMPKDREGIRMTINPSKLRVKVEKVGVLGS